MNKQKLPVKERIPEKGFTLIELIMAIAIIAIVTAIALPSYQSSVKKSARADAKSALAIFHTDMLRHYSTLNTIKGAYSNDIPTLFPDEIPIDGERKNYDIRIVDTTDDTRPVFSLRAIPKAGTIIEEDGYFQIDALGIKSWDKNNNGSIGSDEFTWD